MTRPFRFIVSMPRLADGVAAWQSALRRIEDLGYSTVAISDHFTQGWAMEPLVTLAAAAAETERVRLLTLVLGNDYRHPVLVHKAAATIDVISGGRVELGRGGCARNTKRLDWPMMGPRLVGSGSRSPWR
jgi:alkanesulfonate monooxygenase SsuD/methylene tetrahydromethanopterin reductase-like flavin-dependent oxidoreductase (luciferase family)